MENPSVPYAILRKHIEDKILNTSLEMRPFPHLVISDFFPDDIYRKIHEFNLFKKNIGVDWLSKKGMLLTRNSTPYDHRKQINFHKDERVVCNKDEEEFWGLIKDCFLIDDWFPKLIYKKFPEYFEIRFGESLDSESFWNSMKKELFLQRHESGYYIGPHTDISTRVFTCIFSLAESIGFEEFGTQLLTHTDPKVRCWGDSHYGFENFSVEKTAPYSPNNFLLFFKTRQSFHAVKTITREVPNERYGMQFQYYEPFGGYFKDLSRPDLMQLETYNFYGRVYNRIKKLVKF